MTEIYNKPMRWSPLGEWRACSATKDNPAEVRLQSGLIVLRIHFWPYACAQTREFRSGEWKDGDGLVGRVLREFIRMRRKIRQRHRIKVDRQMEFVFVRELDPISDYGCPVAEAIERAFRVVPAEVRDALERLRGNPWPSLLLASRSQRACELLETHLQLFSLWSRRLEDERESLASIDQQLELPRHRQLERLGCLVGKRWVKLLGKVRGSKMRKLNWDAFTRWIRQPESESLVNQLSHAPRISVTLLNFLTDPVLRVHVPDAVLQKCLHPKSKHILRATIALAQLHQALPAAQHLLPIPSKNKALLRAGKRAEAVLENLRSHSGIVLTECFPTPKSWVFLDRIEAIVEEGLTQQLCLAEDAYGYLDSDVLLYRIEKPIRATLQLSQDEEGVWRITQLFAKSNALVTRKQGNRLMRTLRRAQARSRTTLQPTPKATCFEIF